MEKTSDHRSPSRQRRSSDESIIGISTPASRLFLQSMENSSAAPGGEVRNLTLQTSSTAIQIPLGPQRDIILSQSNYPAPYNHILRSSKDAKEDGNANSEDLYTHTTPSSRGSDNDSNNNPPNDPAPQANDNANNSPFETRSLNLVCYRSWASGPKSCRIKVARRPSNSPISRQDFVNAVKHENNIINTGRKEGTRLLSTDREFLHALRRGYETKLRDGWRRAFSLKSLRCVRLRVYNKDNGKERPRIVYNMNELDMDDFLYQVYHIPHTDHPADDEEENHWIDWVFEIQKSDKKRHQLEFVEGWSPLRLTVATSIPVLASTVLGVLWSVLRGDIQTGFALAGFLLAAGAVVAGLMGVISNLS